MARTAVALVLAAVAVLAVVLLGQDDRPPTPLSAGVGEVLGLTPDQVVTTHDGEPVTGAEVLRAAAAARAEVLSEFTPYGTHDGFWDRPHDGVTPRERLRERAVAAAVLDKARRIWAREAGLITRVDERAFQDELAAENARRAEAAASGRPLPGVPSYDEHTFAQVRAAELDAALSELHAAGLDLSERRLREQYTRMAGPGAPPFEESRENVRRALIVQEYAKALRSRV